MRMSLAAGRQQAARRRTSGAGPDLKAAPVSVPGSHASMFTHPAELADALIQVAAAR
jgi:hypothetical protein